MNTGGEQSRTPATVLCLGMVVLNRVFRLPAFPERPQKVNASDYYEQGGGPAATAAVAIAAMGGNSLLAGRVGDDAEGETVSGLLARAGVSTDAVRRVVNARTATSAVLVDDRGERLLAAWPGTELDASAKWIDGLDVAKVDAVLVDSRWPAGATRLLDIAAEQGIPSILDADLGSRDEIEPLVAAADHVIFSEPGILSYTGEPSQMLALRRLAPATRGLVAVTLGARGVAWIAAGAESHREAYSIDPADTTGAGDVFHGIYALSIAERRSVSEAMERASAAAALKCRNAAGWQGMPGRADVDAFLEQHKPGRRRVAEATR